MDQLAGQQPIQAAIHQAQETCMWTAMDCGHKAMYAFGILVLLGLAIQIIMLSKMVKLMKKTGKK